MTRPAARPQLVLVCQGCRYAVEPVGSDDLHAVTDGCPECGDWLYLGDLADHPPVPRPRRAEG